MPSDVCDPARRGEVLLNKLKTPIALFTYNRPEHTQLALETLARCARLDECQLYVYCDGPKNFEQTAGVEASRQVVRGWSSRLCAKVIERSENLGLAHSIVSGVTELCKKYGRVIVIEDDFALSPDFLDYMLQALDRYQDRSEVYQISGYMFPIEHPPLPDAFFLPLSTTWGWATWERAWRVFDWNASGWQENGANREMRRRFDLDDSYPYSEMLEQRLANQNDSWGILFWWAVFQTAGLVLHPRRSLVWHGGFDGSGVHCGQSLGFRQASLEDFAQARLAKQITLPEKVVSNEAAFNKIKMFLRALRQKPEGSFLNSIRHRIRRYL